MTMRYSLSLARDSIFRRFRHRDESFVALDEESRLSDCAEEVQGRIRRLASEELRRAGLIGQKLDKLQQAEIGLKVSRRLLEEGIEGR